MSTATAIEYDPVTGLPVGATYVEKEKDGRKYKTIAYNGKTYISESDLKRVYGIEYTAKRTFANKTTNQYITINFSTDSFAVKAVMYFDFSLFSELIGE